MIPRLKPAIGAAEFAAILRPGGARVEEFERAFAAAFGARHAVAFPYGRSALWAWFKALGIEGAEVVLPAYTCVVVAHAIALSGNTCRFVDVSLRDYNMDLDELERAITPRTRAVLPTHLFGYPLDLDRVREIVADAEIRYGHRIFVVHDCAHAFGARWHGRLVCADGDAALFGLGISKMMTAIFGGMLTLNDDRVAGLLRQTRDSVFRPAGLRKALSRRLYLFATAAAFSRPAYPFVRWLEHETSMLDSMTKAYHLDDIIHFPPDHLERMADVEARVGLTQLTRYEGIVQGRERNARHYDARLRGVAGWVLPPLVEGATYSHYVVRVPNRKDVIDRAAHRGVDLGELIQYSVPHMASYRIDAADRLFPNALAASRQTINLPVHTDLSVRERDRVVSVLSDMALQEPSPAALPVR